MLHVTTSGQIRLKDCFKLQIKLSVFNGFVHFHMCVYIHVYILLNRDLILGIKNNIYCNFACEMLQCERHTSAYKMRHQCDCRLAV